MKRYSVGVLIGASILASCASPQGGRANLPAASLALTGSAWVDSVMRTLTLRDKVAQMVWPSTWGDYAATNSNQWKNLSKLVREEKVGGFTMSVGSPTEIATKINALQGMSGIPLIFGADFETGAGYRARGPYFLPNAIDLGGAVMLPPQMALGATRDTALAYEAGRVTAIEGRALGVQIAYAPVLDVNNNAANPVINVRSYGEDPSLVARMGAAFIRGVQDNGMVATGKHFPGHGDTEVNSHMGLPVVAVSRSRLDTVEFVPFKGAVAADVGAMMSFHGLMPALDPAGVPGTLSSVVMQNVLRRDLGFHGMLISDAMDMRGVLEQFGGIEAAKRAVAAGMDVLIQPVDVHETIEAVLAGVREGRYTEAHLDSSVRRILIMKEKMGLARSKLVRIEDIRAKVGDSAHHALAQRIAQRSITLVKDSLSQLPLSADKAKKILLVGYAGRTDLGATVTFNSVIASRFATVRSELVNAGDPSPNYARIEAAADSADIIIVSSYSTQSIDQAMNVSAPASFAGFINRLVGKGRKPIVIAFGNPYFLQQVQGVPAYVVAWGGFAPSQSAAARALLGDAPITGKLPITIPLSAGNRTAVFGAGLTRD
ncbi:MAG: glycoside hydrolase family 3 C-terminal domain-containing protein [Gemmatimonadaceae bacterium]|nr:glycoside hydrolase family 3 C-terminal domain-containing protein [Gemmatimonadaceae bacterium]